MQINQDELPNTCSAMPYTHPNRLATIATVFGMHPPPVQTCRVLELACCNGSNIIAIAQSLPGAQCVGIDVSAEHIAQGNAVIKAVGLNNIQLKNMNLLDINADLGLFDYIIAHSIYSYVAPEVQEKILAICQQHLTAQGVAYISYDTKPGWHMQQTLQDVLQYHARYLPNRQFSSQALQTMLQAFDNAIAENNSAYNTLLQAELKKATQVLETYLSPAYKQHEALYFHEFIDRIRKHQLNYLGDVHFHSMLVSNFPPAIQKVLQVTAKNLLLQEQTMDLFTNRHFRHTLLCHDHVVLSRNLTPTILKKSYIASSLQLKTADENQQTFENRMGHITTNKPVVQSVLRYLNQQSPQAVAFSDLLIQMQQEIGHPLTEEEQHLITSSLLRCYSSGLIEFHAMPLPLVTTPSEQPQASPLARWQAKQGNQVSNLRCEPLTLKNPIWIKLLPHLDGEHNRQKLLVLLKEWVDQGLLKLQVNPVDAEKTVDLTDTMTTRVLTQVLDESLQLIAKAGLLQA